MIDMYVATHKTSKMEYEGLNKKYWICNSAGCCFDKYAYLTLRKDMLEQVETHKFKYPERCRKIYGEGWRQYLGAGQFCDPEYKEEDKKKPVRRGGKKHRKKN